MKITKDQIKQIVLEELKEAEQEYSSLKHKQDRAARVGGEYGGRSKRRNLKKLKQSIESRSKSAYDSAGKLRKYVWQWTVVTLTNDQLGDNKVGPLRVGPPAPGVWKLGRKYNIGEPVWPITRRQVNVFIRAMETADKFQHDVINNYKNIIKVLEEK